MLLKKGQNSKFDKFIYGKGYNRSVSYIFHVANWNQILKFITFEAKYSWESSLYN